MKNITLQALILFLAIATHAQAPAFQAVLKLRQDSVHMAVEALYKNNSNERQELFYQLELHKKDAHDNTSTQRQEGEFKAAPGAIVPLSRQKFNTSEGMRGKALLRIMQDGKVVATDSLSLAMQLPVVPPTREVLPRKAGDHANDPTLEIDGLLINNTRTKAGKDFYNSFYTLWSPPANARDYTIRMEERPPRGRASMISIYVNDHLVFQRYLQPRNSDITAAAKEAVSRTSYIVENLEALQQQLNSGEMSGSGIY